MNTETKTSLVAVCNSCLQPKPLTRCSKCKSAAYCSKTCQAVDWKLVHKHNCIYLKARIVTDPVKGRCMLNTGQHTGPGDVLLKDLVVIDNHRRDVATQYTPLLDIADNLIKEYGSADVPVIGWLFLISNYLTKSTLNNITQHKKPSTFAADQRKCHALLTDLDGDVKLIHPKMAKNVRQCADMVSTFLPNIIYKEDPKLDTGILSVSQVETLLSVFVQNAVQTLIQPGLTPAQDVYASGLCLRASLIEHACVPNANMVSLNGVVEIRAVRNIQPGERINIAYRKMYGPTGARRDQMRDFYNFTCQCEACLSPDLPTRRFFCPRSKVTHMEKDSEQQDNKTKPSTTATAIRPDLGECKAGTMFPNQWVCDSCGYKLTDEQIDLYLFRESEYDDMSVTDAHSVGKIRSLMFASSTDRALHYSHYYVHQSLLKLLRNQQATEKLSFKDKECFIRWIIDGLNRVFGPYGDKLANYQHSLAIMLQHETGEPTKFKLEAALNAYNDAYRIRIISAGKHHPLTTRLKLQVDSCARALHSYSKQ